MNLLCLVCLLKNGIIANKKKIIIPASTKAILFLKVLQQEKYIYSFKIISNKQIEVFLFFIKNKNRISNLKKIGKPSKFLYFSYQDLWRLNRTLYTIILSNKDGIITHTSALKLKQGGKVISVLF